MRRIALLLLLIFAAGCWYVPPRRAKACSSCKRARPASHATHIK